VRLLGQLMAAQKAAGLMAKGTQSQLIGRGIIGGSDLDPPIRWEPYIHYNPDDPLGDGGYYGPINKPITLAEAGIDKHLADRAMIYLPSPANTGRRDSQSTRDEIPSRSRMDPLRHHRCWTVDDSDRQCGDEMRTRSLYCLTKSAPPSP